MQIPNVVMYAGAVILGPAVLTLIVFFLARRQNRAVMAAESQAAQDRENA